MPYDVKRFIFSVSLCAILAVNPVLATAPGETESVGTAHTVYDVTKLNKATNGIAGVGYVNRMVDAAGNAAELAEGHAAAAGAHALSAAQSAAEAHEVLDEKLDKSGWPSYMAIVTDSSGSVAPGYITNGMLADGAVTPDKLSVSGAHSYSGFLAYTGNSDGLEMMAWRQVGTDDIADGAVKSDKIADGAVTESKIDAKHVDVLGPGSAGILVMISGTSNNNIQWLGATGAAVMKADKNGVIEWGQLGTNGISNGAVTIDKTAGVVGMVPVGAEGATTYGSFWIE